MTPENDSFEEAVTRLVEAVDLESDRKQVGYRYHRPETVFDDERVDAAIRRVTGNLQETAKEPEIVATTPEAARVRAFFARVREQYGLEENRDRAATYALRLNAEDYSRPRRFAFIYAPVTLAVNVRLKSEDGRSFEAMVTGGDEERAKQLLVAKTYQWFADAGDSLTNGGRS